MSYCRFSDGDVYLYAHVDGYIYCCACRLLPRTRSQIAPYVKQMMTDLANDPTARVRLAASPFFKSESEVAHLMTYARRVRDGKVRFSLNWNDKQMASAHEALAHLYEHKQRGHRVGRGAIARLKREVADERN